ncbi:ferredoxin [Dehalobacter sp. DCM]|uniref:ferredoxin n=1 Tax=Dehalobacter sp. DCM TaxID=2907827 RepID=UPI003081ED6D|nr:ferredoxin [Dehalobacter sp. DCM]
MIAIVEKDACIGCGACISICPEIFEMDEDGLAATNKDQVPENLEESAQEAAESCPTEAIIIS